MKSFLWLFCRRIFINFLQKWRHRNVTEMIVFLLLLYSEYRIAEMLQKRFLFCSYPLVSAEMKSCLWLFFRWFFVNFLTKWRHRDATEMVVFLQLLYREYRIAEMLQKRFHFCTFSIVPTEEKSFLWHFCKLKIPVSNEDFFPKYLEWEGLIGRG